jgi:hypothetical protein
MGKGYTVTVVVEAESLEMAKRIANKLAGTKIPYSPVSHVHIGDPHAIRTAETKLEHYVWLFNSQAIDKFEFYDATKHYSAQAVAEASGIDLGVVQDRRRYLRQLAKQG